MCKTANNCYKCMNDLKEHDKKWSKNRKNYQTYETNQCLYTESYQKSFLGTKNRAK